MTYLPKPRNTHDQNGRGSESERVTSRVCDVTKRDVPHASLLSYLINARVHSHSLPLH
jgi:hypothetical protein